MSRSSSRFDVVAQLGALRRYARSLTRNDTDAEDLVQDALLRAYEGRGGFRSSGSLETAASGNGSFSGETDATLRSAGPCATIGPIAGLVKGGRPPLCC